RSAMARPAGVASLLDYASAQCCFPSMDEWASGPDLPDPYEVFAKTFGALQFATGDGSEEPRSPLGSSLAYPGAICRSDSKCVRYSLKGSRRIHLMFDQGESIIIVKRDDDLLVRETIRIL